jgi:hypothetical protein
VELKFKAKIYKTGINPCVDVPRRITKNLTAVKGYIRVKGTINGFGFKQTLVPVKDSPYRLFVNIPMLKGGETEVGKSATFSIEQNSQAPKKEYTMLLMLRFYLKNEKLTSDFNQLTPSRKKDILKYLGNIKTEETMVKNVRKVIDQLKRKVKTVRVP